MCRAQFTIYIETSYNMKTLITLGWCHKIIDKCTNAQMHTWPLLRDSTLVLLNTIPPHIDLVKLQRDLVKSVKGISSIHELHVWRLVGR